MGACSIPPSLPDTFATRFKAYYTHYVLASSEPNIRVKIILAFIWDLKRFLKCLKQVY